MFLTRCIITALITIGVVPAYAASSIDVTQPVQGVPYNASPIRQNFGDAANDINALQSMNAGPTAPANPSLGTLWLNTSGVTYALSIWIPASNSWVPIASINSSTGIWEPPVGGGTLPSLLSAATTDLGSVPQAAVQITGSQSIASFGASTPAGVMKFLIFLGSPTLVYNATYMQLPGSANYIPRANSSTIALSLGGGRWQVGFVGPSPNPAFTTLALGGASLGSNTLAMTGTFFDGSATNYTVMNGAAGTITWTSPNAASTEINGVVQNCGLATTTAGAENGDCDWSVYVNGTPQIVAINGSLPAFTPAIGDIWNLGGVGQAWKNGYIDEILDEAGRTQVFLSNGGLNFDLVNGRLTGSNGNALAVYDYLGNQVANFNSIGTACNYILFLARATSIPASIQPQSTCDTNQNLNITALGTGLVHILNVPLTVDGAATFNGVISATMPIDLFGSSMGYTAISTLNASATNYSIAFPAASGTLALATGASCTFHIGFTNLVIVNGIVTSCN